MFGSDCGVGGQSRLSVTRTTCWSHNFATRIASNGLEPFCDVVPFFVVELTAQFLPSEGSQVAAAIDKKFGLRNLVFIGESV